MKLLWILALLVALSDGSKPKYKVLVIGPMASRSLYHLMKSLSEALGNAGHSVTLVTSYQPSSKHSNVTEINTGISTSHLEDQNIFELQGIFSVFHMINEAIEDSIREMWSNEEMKRLWEVRNEFDAIVIISYVNEAAVPFLLDYEGVFINFCTPGVEFITISQHGNWLPLSVTPTILLPFDDYMSFWERMINPWVTWISYNIYQFTTYPLIQRALDEFFPKLPINELYSSSRLTLINGHFALDGPVPLLPTQIEIGTINAKPPKPLPKNLEEFADGSGEAGVIYFSLGSVAKSNDIPHKYKIMFLEAFKRIPQKVIWKYEGDDLDLPENVIAQTWLPQQDVLGHPKTRLFISHCGNLGTQEAKYHGVPVLAVPIAFDQPRNAARMERKGFGMVLNWDDMTTDAILNAIHILLHDPSYAATMKQVSEALKDQKESPGERAVWWIEYAIRHKGQSGSSHMDYAGKRFHFLQYMMVDVVVAWTVVIFLWMALCCRCCIAAYRCCCMQTRKKSKKQKQS